jgi:hypothetical protein
VSDPKQDSLKVIAGADLDETYSVWDNETGDYVDWTTGTWEVEMVIRARNEQQVARIANFGTRDGEITLLDGGLLRVQLLGVVTAELPYSRVYTNSTDLRVVGWRYRNPLFFDLIATSGGDVSDLVQGTLTVHQPIS